MTRKEMFDLSIASDGFRDAVRKALFECSKFPPCTERMIVEGRLAEALYFSAVFFRADDGKNVQRP